MATTMSLPRAALEVVTSPVLFPLIASFQLGVPVWTVEYEHTFGSAISGGDELSLHDRVKLSMATKGLLPQLAIHNYDMDTLARLYELYRQPNVRKMAKFSFESAMDDAAVFASLEALQWLKDNTEESCEPTTVSTVVLHGHADVLFWLLANQPECQREITTATMENAAALGHLEVIKVLHEWSPEGCTTEAMDGAAANGHLAVVVFLHQHRIEGCTTAAIDRAAESGHLHVVEWLLALREEGFTEAASFGAVIGGYLEILQGLWKNRRAGYEEVVRAGMQRAIPEALRECEVAMVAFLHELVPEAFPLHTLAIAAENPHAGVLQFVQSAGFAHDGIEMCLQCGHKASRSCSHCWTNKSLVFNLDVLELALAETNKMANRVGDDEAGDLLDPSILAMQVRLRQLIVEQEKRTDDPAGNPFLPLASSARSPTQRHHARRASH